jgi:hypothetical protein
MGTAWGIRKLVGRRLRGIGPGKMMRRKEIR